MTSPQPRIEECAKLIARLCILIFLFAHFRAMASGEPEVNGTVEGDESQPLKKTQAAEASTDLEKITDYEEDKEISSQDIANAVSLIEGRYSEERKEKAQKEKELSQVKIKKEDVDLIVDQMEISQILAEKRLREHKGDVVEALVSLLN